MGLRACGEEAGQVHGPLESDDGSVGPFIGSPRIDRLVLLLGPEAADRIEQLHRKTERVDHRVTRGARFGPGLLVDPLARGQVRVQVRRQRRDRFLGRTQTATEQASGHEDAAVNRRGGRVVGEPGHQEGMGHQTGAGLRIEPDAPEGSVFRQIGPVNGREPAVEVDSF